ncbi:hypothetical protein ACTQ6A_10835 [Lachnospiraceae bacterium LCP25S3_G4]
MFKTIVDSYFIFYFMGVVGVIGILSKFIAHITLKRMVKAASNMAKSTHKLMRLVRAKFEHACMVSDKVENIDVFVEKYIYEYRVLGLKLHTWQRLEKQVIWMSCIITVLGTAASYQTYGMHDITIRYGALGLAEMVILFLICQATDEKYKLNVSKVYMVDYLENVCAHRYAKVYGKEGQAAAEMVKQEYIANEVIKEQEEVTQEVDQNALIKEATSEPDIQSELQHQPKKPEIQTDISSQQVPPEILQKDIPQPEVKVTKSKEEEETDKVADIMPREAMIREILEEFLA